MKPNPIAASYHGRLRSTVRIVGPILLAAGGLFIVVGLVDFFSAASDFQTPHLFWCLFVGVPLVFFGAVCCMVGFMGAAARYSAAETAPVAADTFNYIAGETRPGISAVAAAIADGLRAEKSSVSAATEERLKRLEEMKQSSLITEQEYQQQRNRIIATL